jgi:hypothetical protein
MKWISRIILPFKGGVVMGILDTALRLSKQLYSQRRDIQTERLGVDLSKEQVENKEPSFDIQDYQQDQWDKQAKQEGFVIGVSNKLYFLTLFENPKGISSTVYLERIEGEWKMWRETYKQGERHAIGIRNISTGESLTTILKQSKRYMDYLRIKTNK